MDTFVLYDDVNFIKQGWINRNRILLENREFLFTLPLNDPSSFKLINEVGLNERNIKWREKFYKTIESAYRKAPYFELIYEMIKSIVEAEHKTIAELASSSICVTSEYLGIKTRFITSSLRGYNNTHLKSQERVIDICEKENASKYINPLGGADLYSKEDFLEKKLTLHFLKTIPINYKQFNDLFVPNLSMIDVLMFNSAETIQGFLQRYELL